MLFCHFIKSSPYARRQCLKSKSDCCQFFFSESKITLSALAHILNQNNLICTSKKGQLIKGILFFQPRSQAEERAWEGGHFFPFIVSTNCDVTKFYSNIRGNFPCIYFNRLSIWFSLFVFLSQHIYLI